KDQLADDRLCRNQGIQRRMGVPARHYHCLTFTMHEHDAKLLGQTDRLAPPVQKTRALLGSWISLALKTVVQQPNRTPQNDSAFAKKSRLASKTNDPTAEH